MEPIDGLSRINKVSFLLFNLIILLEIDFSPRGFSLSAFIRKGVPLFSFVYFMNRCFALLLLVKKKWKQKVGKLFKKIRTRPSLDIQIVPLSKIYAYIVTLILILLFPVLCRIAGSSYAAYVGFHMELVSRQAFHCCFITMNVVVGNLYFGVYFPLLDTICHSTITPN